LGVWSVEPTIRTIASSPPLTMPTQVELSKREQRSPTAIVWLKPSRMSLNRMRLL
jgi:hypothetical protein